VPRSPESTRGWESRNAGSVCGEVRDLQRGRSGLEDLPVCIVTGHPEFRKLIYDRPVPPPEGYMDKPVNEEKLVSNIRRILELRERRD